MSEAPALSIGLLLFPALTQLDLTGPYEVFVRAPNAKVHLIWKTAQPVSERVVQDRNRITGAGVTSGIDFALTVVAGIYGAEVAQAIQLHMEYDPAPPFASGSPHVASAELLNKASAQVAPFTEKRRKATEKAAANLQLNG